MTAEGQGWLVFDAVAAARVLGRGEGEELPQAAADALGAGCDTPSLRVLAGMDGAGWSELDAVLAGIWAERGVGVPSQHEAEKLLIDHLLRAVVAGRWSARECARRMWSLCGVMPHLDDRDLHELEAPEHSFDYLELTVCSYEDVERQTIETARTVLARGGVRVGVAHD